MRLHRPALGLATGAAIGFLIQTSAVPSMAMSDPGVRVAQAAAPPAEMSDPGKAITAEARMQRRFPQPVRVGDLIGLPVLDDDHRTLGYVREVERTPQGKIKLIVGYSDWFGWLGWGARPVAVPVEVVGIRGREISSIDMPRSEYATAPTWQASDATRLSDGDSIILALTRS